MRMGHANDTRQDQCRTLRHEGASLKPIRQARGLEKSSLLSHTPKEKPPNLRKIGAGALILSYMASNVKASMEK